MGGMSGIARLLHPTLPFKGVDYEDVAIMLTKVHIPRHGMPCTSHFMRYGVLHVAGTIAWCTQALMGAQCTGHLWYAGKNGCILRTEKVPQ